MPRTRNHFGAVFLFPLGLYKRPLKKTCRIIPVGGLGVPPSLIRPPRLGGWGVDQDYFSNLIKYLKHFPFYF